MKKQTTIDIPAALAALAQGHYREARELASYTQEGWAAACGVSRFAVQGWDSGRHSPHPPAVVSMRKAIEKKQRSLGK